MVDKGKGKSYWPFKKLKLDSNIPSIRDEEISGNTNIYSNMGGKNSRRTEEASLGSSGRGGSGESSATTSIGRAQYGAADGPGPEGHQQNISATLDIQDAIMQDAPSTKYSRDTVEQRYQKTLEKDPESYCVTMTTVQQQAAQESNFIGSAYFYNLNLYQVQDTVGGDYLVVYARPKTSNSYPRGSATEVFDPSFEFRCITIHTDGPKKGHPDERKTNSYLSQGYWAFGMLRFNGIRLGLAFDGPETRDKDKAEVYVENFDDVEGLTGVFEKAVDYGCRPHGSTARFGIKEMFYENHLQYGFQFIELNLAVVNQITKMKDFHHVVAIKLPKKRDVASSFLLKQPIAMPHYSWYQFQRHVTRDLNKLGGTADVEMVASDSDQWDGYGSPANGDLRDSADFWEWMYPKNK